ncbi:MAG TPA: redoxin family protein [Nitrososphaeraceae archaeon]|nr:redoxin family protein [Nitrososphaeraceae archaeon]
MMEKERKNGAELTMNRDNITASVMAMTVVVAVIIGFTIYFNNPILNQAWSAQQQKDKGLVVGGVHSPEFEFEKNYTNMKRAAQTRITHPAIEAGMVENQNHTITTIKLNTTQLQQIDKSQFTKAPEFAQISGYINTPNNNSPITLSSLKGKVVLVYIWTYTCINSIRPMPYIDDWNQKYSKKGLVIVGVHSPEFGFEKNYANVKDAVQRFGITYPVILDSDHGTWNAYENNYWPRFYLIDTQGYIRYDHIGEGSYDQIEKAIQSLVAERAALMGAKEISFDANPTTLIKPGSLYYIDLRQSTTPEIYIGYNTARTPLGNPEGFKPDQIVSYSIPSNTNFKPSIVYLQGKWKNNPDSMELQSDTGRIALVYYAKSVNIIAGGKGEAIVSNDNDYKLGAGGYGHAAGNSTANISDNSLGQDLSSDGSFRIDGQRLYNLAIHNNYAAHYIVIDVKGKGFQFYTFTFG